MGLFRRRAEILITCGSAGGGGRASGPTGPRRRTSSGPYGYSLGRGSPSSFVSSARAGVATTVPGAHVPAASGGPPSEAPEVRSSAGPAGSSTYAKKSVDSAGVLAASVRPRGGEGAAAVCWTSNRMSRACLRLRLFGFAFLPSAGTAAPSGRDESAGFVTRATLAVFVGTATGSRGAFPLGAGGVARSGDGGGRGTWFPWSLRGDRGTAGGGGSVACERTRSSFPRVTGRGTGSFAPVTARGAGAGAGPFAGVGAGAGPLTAAVPGVGAGPLTVAVSGTGVGSGPAPGLPLLMLLASASVIARGAAAGGALRRPMRARPMGGFVSVSYRRRVCLGVGLYLGRVAGQLGDVRLPLVRQ